MSGSLGASHTFPLVTVVMPVRDAARSIATSLGAVLAQDYPPDRMEVYVVDGLSSDGTREIVRAFQGADARVHLIENPQRIVPAGLNLAIRESHGTVVVRVDGHTVIAPDYARESVAALERSGADCVGGRIAVLGEGAVGSAIALATSSPFGVGGARFRWSSKEAWVDTVYPPAWPRHVFERIGVFDEELVRDQDDEFSCRLRANGGRILLSPRLRSTYYARGSIGALWRQYYRYGFWKVRVMQKHARQMRPRQFVPPVFVLAVALSVALVASPAGIWPLVGLAGAYGLTSLGASLAAVRRDRLVLLPLLPVAFATLHVAYGTGFLVGLARFWRRWREPDAAPARLSAEAGPTGGAIRASGRAGGP